MTNAAGDQCGACEAVAIKGKHCAHCQPWLRRALPWASSTERTPLRVAEHTSMGTPGLTKGARLAASSDKPIQAITAHVHCRVRRKKLICA